jgi:hypothetical protein
MKKIILCLLLALILTRVTPGETAFIPGNVNALCYFDNFFYNLPENDFFYYLNDAMLYSEPPDDQLYESGRREKIRKLIRQHRQIKEFILSKGNAGAGTISLNLKSADDFQKAIVFFNLLGIGLKKGLTDNFLLQPAPADDAIPFYSFYSLKIQALSTQLNSTGMFFFKLTETRLHLPWDFQFLNNISGLKIDAESFFENMIANKKFSLLLAILFRLSDDEINFISQSIPKESGSAWKRIFQDKLTLMGMLVLSNSLRVRDGQLLLPGGNAAHDFWTALVGIDHLNDPFGFITTLAGKDNGKLNYLYVFSFFLAEEARKAVFFNYDSEKIQRLYQKLSLGENEKIKANAFPRLESLNYFSLLYTLKIKNNRIDLPLGGQEWAKALELELPPQADDCAFFSELSASSGKSSKKMGALQKFSTIYAKFAERPWLLTPEILKKLFRNFDKNSSLIDFIEKIPLKKPETIAALFTWQEALLEMNQKDQLLFTALGQSLLEIISQMAWFAPDRYDYDRIVSDLLAISWQLPDIYDQIFVFIKNQTGVNSTREITDESLLNLVLSGLKNQLLTIQNQNYEWLVKDVFKASLIEMLRSQEDCTLTVLAEINNLLNNLCQIPADFPKSSGRRLLEAIEELPYPDFSKDAPKILKDRVLAYSKSDLDLDLQKLLKMSEMKAPQKEMQKAVQEIKNAYLLPNLKDFFVTMAYALNAKNQKLRVFSNPNLVRLHDFSESDGATPWNSSSSPGNKLEFSGYYLKGGLARLNLTFSNNWCIQLFDKNVFNNGHAQAMINNILAMLPLSLVNHSPDFDALLVEFAVQLLQKCSSDEKLKTEIKNTAKNLLAGYHYRRLDDFFSGRSNDYYLFFCELQQIGGYFFKSGAHVNEFSQQEELGKFAQMPLSAVIAQESDFWGNIYYHSSGSLRPRQYNIFPQEIANLFASGWVSGERIREFKIKTAYLAHKNNFPSSLLGQFIFDYFHSVLKPIYAQNHEKDYVSTYFVIDIMNISHLKNTLKKMLKEGALRLK